MNELTKTVSSFLRILKAQEEGYFNAFIVCPPGVHDVGGPLKRPSVFFKYALGDSLQNRRVSYIGEGTNVIGFVRSCFAPHSKRADLIFF